jgi:hypothetical protein
MNKNERCISCGELYKYHCDANCTVTCRCNTTTKNKALINNIADAEDVVRKALVGLENKLEILQMEYQSQINNQKILINELIEALETSEKFLLHVKFFPDGCNCYEDYICQSCRASDIWRKLDELLKKVKGESDGQ